MTTTPEPPNESEVQEPEPSRLRSGAKVLLVVAALAGAVALIFVGTGADQALVYSKDVHVVMASPDQFVGKALRVEGDLKNGSIQFREEPCEWRFTLLKEGKEMPVRYPQCVVPDTFRDGMGISVTVEGQIEPGGEIFLASQVIPKCPSKYEMKQRQENGETMPHAQPMAAAPES